MTPEELLALGDRVVAGARPGEQVEAALTWSRDTEVRAYDGAVEQFTSATAAGLGVRVVAAGREGFAYTTSLEPPDLEAALAEARDNSGFATPDPHAGLAEPDGVDPPALVLVDDRLAATPTDVRIGLALELERAVRAGDPRIVGVEGGADYSDAESVTAVVSTTGVRTASAETACALAVYSLAEEDGSVGTGFGFSVGRHPGELDVAAAAGDAVARACRILGARPAPTARVAVVLDPWVTAQLVSILAGAFSAEEVLKGRSLFAGRLGEQVASPLVSLVDDPTDPRAWGASATDGEGLATRANELVVDGVVRGVLHDARTARSMGTTSTGSAVRHGITAPPEAGAQASWIRPGRHRPEDLLALVGDGVLVQEVVGLHSGVNPVSGDVSTGIEGLRIRGGELAEPIREVTIATTLQKLLSSVVGVGDDLEFFPFDAAGVSLAVGEVTLSGSSA